MSEDHWSSSVVLFEEMVLGSRLISIRWDRNQQGRVCEMTGIYPGKDPAEIPASKRMTEGEAK